MTAAMPDVRTLTLLLEREEAARDAVLLALQQAENHLAQARTQHEALTTYRSEYIARWSAQMQQSASIEVVHCYRSFMVRLDQALEQQTAMLRRAEATVASRRTERIAAETRVAAIARLIGRRVDTHRLAEHRRDQRLTDEAATRAAWNGGSAGRTGPAH
jgi:flagellar FliJ protein